MPDNDKVTEKTRASETTEKEEGIESNSAESVASDAEDTAKEKVLSMGSELDEVLDADEGSDLATELLAAIEEESPEEETVVKRATFTQLKPSDDKTQEENIERLLDVTLDVSVELGRKTMAIKDILSLGPGHIIELDKLAGEPVDLLINGKKMAKGEVVVVDENFGIRITDLISPEERLKNL